MNVIRLPISMSVLMVTRFMGISNDSLKFSGLITTMEIMIVSQ